MTNTESSFETDVSSVRERARTIGRRTTRATAALLALAGSAALSVPTGASAQTEPNLTVGLLNFSIQANHTFTADSGDVADGCAVASSGQKLLRFDFRAQNEGTANTAVTQPVPPGGVSNSIYTWSVAHNHHHLIGFNNYNMYTDNNVAVTTGLKQAFCLMDSLRIDPASNVNQTFTCSMQGVSWGWTDIYGSGLACQFVNITGVADGTYELVAGTNQSRIVADRSYQDNHTAVRLTISGNTVTVAAPSWRSSVEAVAAGVRPDPNEAPLGISRGPGIATVYYRNASNHLTLKGLASGGWGTGTTGSEIFNSSQPYSLQSGLTGFSYSPNTADVFARASDNSIMWFNWTSTTGWQYASLGGVAGSAPTAVVGTTGALLTVVGADTATAGQVWWTKELTTGGFTGWASIGGVAVREAPAMVATGADTFWVFVRGPFNMAYAQKYSSGTWLPDWVNLGGNFVGPLSAASANVNRIDLVGAESGGALRHNIWNGTSWSGWTTDVSGISGQPTVVSFGPKNVDIFYYVTSGGMPFLYRRHFDGASWASAQVSTLGGTLAAQPGIASWGNGMFYFFSGLSDRSLRARLYQ